MDTIERGAREKEEEQLNSQNHHGRQFKELGADETNGTRPLEAKDLEDGTSSPAGTDNSTPGTLPAHLKVLHLRTLTNAIAQEAHGRENSSYNIEHTTPPELRPLKGLSFLDRFLVIWIFLAMAIGIVLANTVPSTGPALQKTTFVDVSAPIAVGLLLMMYPILCKVQYETVGILSLLNDHAQDRP